MMLPSGLPERVADSEPLARFLTSSSQFNAVMVKPSAFLPPKDRNTSSVFRHGAEPRDGLWRIGSDHVAGQRTLHGVALVTARSVRDAFLEVEANEPPPRHADITGWPLIEADPELTKAKQKEFAAVIAQYAELLRP